MENEEIDADTEIIDVQRIVEIANGNIPDSEITDNEDTLAKIMVFGYQRGWIDCMKQLNAQIEKTVENGFQVSNSEGVVDET
jgi:hypothetical protein